jgi:hypothetical protein
LGLNRKSGDLALLGLCVNYAQQSPSFPDRRSLAHVLQKGTLENAERQEFQNKPKLRFNRPPLISSHLLHRFASALRKGKCYNEKQGPLRRFGAKPQLGADFPKPSPNL